MRLIIDSPWYFVLLCLLLGVVFSVALYFWDRRRFVIPDTFPRRATWLLASLRFLVVFLLAFLLLAPLAKRTVAQKEKPIILVLQDNSSSLNYCKDSAYYHGKYPKQMNSLLTELRKDYDVQTFTYGSMLQQGETLSYGEHTTDMATAMGTLFDQYANRNVGAMILTGDGIFNQGMNPVTMAEKALFPIYTVALGDTTVRKDAAIAHVKFNSVAYLGNQFPLEISVQAKRLQGKESQLVVSHDGKRLFTKKIAYNSDDFFLSETVLVDADKVGLQNYNITIEPVGGEVTIRNNTRVVSVDVIDGRQKILILAAAPHPDVSALRQAIESNQNYEVTVSLAKDFSADLSQYDLVVLHQLPSKIDNSPVVGSVTKAHLPMVFVIGAQSDLTKLNGLHAGLEVFSRIDKTNEATALYNSSFANFSLEEDLGRKIEQFPPLSSPFGEYRLAPSTQSLFTAKVGSVSSGLPLIAFSQQRDIRTAFIVGEGLWKWRMADYQMNGSHEIFDQLVTKMVTYTSLRVSKDRFHVTAQKVYPENSPVEIEAELYNDNFEPVNTPEVVLALTPEGGKSSSYNFNRSGSSYELVLGQLAPGSYHYEASTTFNGKKYSQSGNFVVEQLNLEELNLVADHSLMQTLAQNSGGQMLAPTDIGQLPKLLRQRDDIKNVLYTQTKYTELLNVPWVFILIMLLIGVEWALRKYFGEL